jgi:hypothetical protein
VKRSRKKNKKRSERLAEEEAREGRRRRGRPRVRPPKPEEELVKLAEYFGTLRSGITSAVAPALEPVQRTITSALESMSLIIDDSVQRAVSPVTGTVLGLLPTLVPTVIESLRESLTKMPEVAYSACVAFIPDVCISQCGELVAVSPGLPSECYKSCAENIEKLCRAGTESVRTFIERQLERIESLVTGVVSFTPVVTADVPEVRDRTIVTVRRR